MLYLKILRGKRDVTWYQFYSLFVGNQNQKNFWIRSGPNRTVRFSFRFVIVFTHVC